MYKLLLNLCFEHCQGERQTIYNVKFVFTVLFKHRNPAVN